MLSSNTETHTVPYQRLPELQHLRSRITSLFTEINTNQVHVDISQAAAVSGRSAHQMLCDEMAAAIDALRSAPIAPYGFIKIRNMVLFWKVWYFAEGIWQPLSFEIAMSQTHVCYIRVATLTEWLEQT